MTKRRLFYDTEVYPNLLTYDFEDYQSGEVFQFVLFHCLEDPTLSINQLPDLVTFIKHQVQWLIGYNNHEYDDLILNLLMMNEDRLCGSDIRVITQEAYQLNATIIAYQQYGEQKFPDRYILSNKDYYYSIDLIQQFNTIDRVGLKQLAINLRHPRVEDLPIPPGTVIKTGQVKQILSYQRNDVTITKKVFNHRTEAINDRIKIGKKLGVDVVNKCDTDIAKTILARYYYEGTGIAYKQFSKYRTHYEKINLGSLIIPKIRFQTRHYGRIIDKLHKTSVNPNLKGASSKNKKQFEHVIASKYLTHTMGLGGLHSNNPPEILTESDEYYYIDLDVNSFYPWLMVNEKFYPRHLGEVFIQIYRSRIVDERMTAKKAGDEVIALMLKFAANGTFGLTKSVHSWLYDPKVTYSTCINGELLLMMLIEGLELHSGCVVVYSNTDGLTVRVPKSEYTIFHKLCSRWMTTTGLELEFSHYKRMVIQDVNNYIIFTHDKKKPIKAKGSYSIEKVITKGYENPIVAKAVQSYFDQGIPVRDTICNCRDIYEFISAERTSIVKFKVVLHRKNKPIGSEPDHLQKNNRWIVTSGNLNEGKLVRIALEPNEKGIKEETEMQKGYLVTVLNDVPDHESIDEFCLNYEFYINEAMKMINLKPAEKLTRVVQTAEQGLLFT